ncbi:MAG: hypothetical protein QGG87_05545, partial [Nitrospinota bacterium]|nr:hypothetical protein [Nitrospinota bacterium]
LKLKLSAAAIYATIKDKTATVFVKHIQVSAESVLRSILEVKSVSYLFLQLTQIVRLVNAVKS